MSTDAIHAFLARADEDPDLRRALAGAALLDRPDTGPFPPDCLTAGQGSPLRAGNGGRSQ